MLLGLITLDQAKALELQTMKKSRKAGAEADWDADGQEAMSEADYVSGTPAGYSL